MEESVKVAISFVALIISAVSFIVAQRAAARAKKAEAITHLLGEKETVAFAALKLLRDGLPKQKTDRRLVLAALMQASVFEGSDRSRALLYRVVEGNRVKYRDEILAALQSIKDTFTSMDRFQFRPEELDLERGRRRVAAVEKVINTP